MPKPPISTDILMDMEETFSKLLEMREAWEMGEVSNETYTTELNQAESYIERLREEREET